MALSFTHVSWWLRNGKSQEPRFGNCSSVNSTQDQGLWELDNVKFPLSNEGNISASSRRIKGKWQTQDDKKIDKEHDVVLVPPDSGCVSGSESDDSDWSIGWLEPHGSDFQSDDGESDNSFAVLVPCYKRKNQDVVEDYQNEQLAPIGNFSVGLPAESKRSMEEWLSSIPNDYQPTF